MSCQVFDGCMLHKLRLQPMATGDYCRRQDYSRVRVVRDKEGGREREREMSYEMTSCSVSGR
jgi:hypothetical protein